MPSRLQAYANSKDVKIVGDMPIYVGAQSADVWAHQELFELDDTGAAVNVAGVPPDAFSETGQLWGNPLYDWPVGMFSQFLLSLAPGCMADLTTLMFRMHCMGGSPRGSKEGRGRGVGGRGGGSKQL